jgi:bacteriophage N4 adsorption protein B
MCLVPLAIWILLSGLDDLWIALVFACTWRKRRQLPPEAELNSRAERPIAIFVPLWHESRVIGHMLEHNLSVIRYSNYRFFVGVYPNDPATLRAVAEVAQRDERIHLCVCRHDGPTSKGDCLNEIYQTMTELEGEGRGAFEIVMTHDAEDLVHPESLRLINYYSRDFEMVQIPVLALPTPLREFTHGLYCDEFAEFQTKDIPVRQVLGGFLPANGVGTGFERQALERLAGDRGRIFDPDCLTEDYENGFCLHVLGYRQIFVPVRFQGRLPVATREYFPRALRAAVRQRSRWVAGIALQGWQRHGWNGPWKQVYWFWRDRKGLVGNLLSPFANLIFLAVAGEAIWSAATGRHKSISNQIPLWAMRMCLATYATSLVQVALRAGASSMIYGWRFASLSPVRTLWGNVVNFAATVAALRQFGAARLSKSKLAWRKTEHVYPRPRLGELLVRLRAVPMGVVEEAAMGLPKGVRLGEHLMHLHKVSEDNLYHALALQAGIPLGRPARAEVERSATRVFPAETMRRWKVMPYRVEPGRLLAVTAEVPSSEMTRELAELSTLEIRYRLVRPSEFEELAREYLSTAS